MNVFLPWIPALPSPAVKKEAECGREVLGVWCVCRWLVVQEVKLNREPQKLFDGKTV